MKLQSQTESFSAAMLACFAPVSVKRRKHQLVPPGTRGRCRVEILPRRSERRGSSFVRGCRPGAQSICHTTGASRASPTRTIPAARAKGSFPGGMGWYRKTFHAPADWKGKRVSVEFDGVYRDATVYLNGHKLGTHPYGYTAFAFDLTPELNLSGANVLAVRVDNSAQPNSRWYSGSGIYRHVRVVVTDPTHVAHWGVFVTTPEATSTSAKVSIHTRVANESSGAARVTVETTLLDKAGNKVGSAQSKLDIAPGKEDEAAQEITVANPALWSPDSPSLVPRRFDDPQRWQSHRRSHHTLRHPLARMVGGEGSAAERQAHQAHRRQRPS